MSFSYSQRVLLEKETIAHNSYSESCFVRSKDGVAAGEKLWTQMASKLENIRPGVMEGI